MDFVSFLKESFLGSMDSVFTMSKIVIPLMIVMEILKDSNILEKISRTLSPISRFFNISEKSTFPLIIGIIFGLAYGAGIIIDSAKEGNLTKKDLYVLIIFLVCCHSVFEDTLIFVSMGANGWILVGFRLGIAILFSIISSKIIDKVPCIEKKVVQKSEL